MDEQLIPSTGSEGLIVVKQLPIIEEQLRNVAEAVKQRVEQACSVAYTAESLADVKRIRAELNKEFDKLEKERKFAKKTVLEPYEKFEATYKECISEVYKKADVTLSELVSNGEYHLRHAKEQEIRRYFTEHLEAASFNPEEWAFERTGIRVLLSTSDKKLKEACITWITNLKRDINTIEGLVNADEVMVEYKRCLNLSLALLVVKDRQKAAEEAREQRERRVRESIVREEAAARMAALAPPVVEDAAPVENDPVLRLTFTVEAPKSKLKALKKFLIDGGYKYE